MTPWTPLFPLADLSPGKMKAKGGVLVAMLEDGSIHATENACPHQGYPLVTGHLSGCTLTCTWHNFKFDIRDGKCVVGDESAPSHPTRVENGIIEVQRNLSLDHAKSYASLDEGLKRAQGGRITREVARLIQGGVKPEYLMAYAVNWDASHAEYNIGHTLALACDLLGWLDKPAPGMSLFEHQVQLVGEVMDLASRSVVALPLRSRPEPEAPGENTASELRRRVEAEDAIGAEALVRGMVAAGWDRNALASTLYPLVADHFLDFGHELIYLGKILDFLDVVGWEWADSFLGGWVFTVAYGTREDLLPPWAAFRGRYKSFVEDGGMEEAYAARVLDVASADPALVEAIVQGSPTECFVLISSALRVGRWGDVLESLIRAGAERLLRFEFLHDGNPTVEEGWLDVTHRFTSAHALRDAVKNWDHPELSRLFLMAAQFINLGRGLDHRQFSPPNATPRADDLRELVLSGRSGRAIFFAHDVKTLVAATKEPDPVCLQAAAWYLGNTLQERPTRRLAVEAVRLLRDGKPPRTLSG